MIKEMDTGEGLSIILRCLAANFILEKHKVDKITKFKRFSKKRSNKIFYKLKISEDYSNYNGNEVNKKSINYKADILYTTFLLFEGNLLEQMKFN